MESSIPSGTYNLPAFSATEVPEPPGEAFDEVIPFGTECSDFPRCLHIVQCGLCVNGHLLQKEAPLTSAE